MGKIRQIEFGSDGYPHIWILLPCLMLTTMFFEAPLVVDVDTFLKCIKSFPKETSYMNVVTYECIGISKLLDSNNGVIG